MFTLRRLARLGPRQRLAKAALVLQAAEESLARGAPDAEADPRRLRDLAELVASWTDGPAAAASIALRDAAAAAAAVAAPGAAPADGAEAPAPDLLRAVNALRHALLARLGAEPSEWDLRGPDGGLDRPGRRILPMVVYLEDVRSPFNVGAIFRTAEAFGAARVVLSPATPPPTHPRAVRTARGAAAVVPWEVRSLAELDVAGGIFALETGGTDVASFPFPRSGTVLVGSEELGLSPEALGLAERSLGRVGIPLAGAKRSLNVAVAFGILMHRWHGQISRPGD